MTQKELQEKVEQFLATLPADDGMEWYDNYRGFGETVLNAFLWWLYPELKPKDLPSWEKFPYKKECKVIVTEWEQLEGKTIKLVEQFFLGGYILVFEDGDYTHVDGSGEEFHGAHWPVLGDDHLEFVKGAVQSMQRRREVSDGD